MDVAKFSLFDYKILIVKGLVIADYFQNLAAIYFQKRENELSVDKIEAGQHSRRLEVFSKLRKLQPLTIKISKEMAFIIDIETDLCYKQGIRAGKKMGNAEGKAEGKAELAEIAVTNMLKTKRFTLSEIAELLSMELDFVQQLKAKIEAATVPVAPVSKPKPARKPRPKKKD